MRVALTLMGLATATGALIFVACSSFSGADANGDPVIDAGSSDAISSDAISSDAGSSDAVLDPCPAGLSTAEAAGLYVMGGQSTYNTSPGYSEPLDVLRATIQCDGHLRDWKTQVRLPRSSVGGAGGLLGDNAFYLGGQHSTGGENFTLKVAYAPFAGGVLQKFFTATAMSPLPFWHAMYGSNGSSFFVAGGENYLSGGMNPQTMVTTWKIGDGGEPVISGNPPQLPMGLSRGAGVMVGDTMVVIAGHVYTAKATDATWRDTNVTYTQTDFTAATDGTSVFLVPGSSGNAAIASFAVKSGAATAITDTGQPGPTLVNPAAVAFHGYLYIIGGLDDVGDGGSPPAINVYSARINGSTLEPLMLEPQMPVGHALAVAFVR